MQNTSSGVVQECGSLSEAMRYYSATIGNDTLGLRDEGEPAAERNQNLGSYAVFKNNFV